MGQNAIIDKTDKEIESLKFKKLQAAAFDNEKEYESISFELKKLLEKKKEQLKEYMDEVDLRQLEKRKKIEKFEREMKERAEVEISGFTPEDLHRELFKKVKNILAMQNSFKIGDIYEGKVSVEFKYEVYYVIYYDYFNNGIRKEWELVCRDVSTIYSFLESIRIVSCKKETTGEIGGNNGIEVLEYTGQEIVKDIFNVLKVLYKDYFV